MQEEILALCPALSKVDIRRRLVPHGFYLWLKVNIGWGMHHYRSGIALKANEHLSCTIAMQYVAATEYHHKLRKVCESRACHQG
jgi:hypothetical protein